VSTGLAVSLLLIIAAAVVGMVPLRRHADRQWAEHQRRMVTVRIALDTTNFVAAVARFQAALAQLGPPVQGAANEFRKFGEAFKRGDGR
jgi:hypothetical protein